MFEITVVPHPDYDLFAVGGIIFKTYAWTDREHTNPISVDTTLYSSNKVYLKIAYEVPEYITNFVFAPWRCDFKSDRGQEFNLFYAAENNCTGCFTLYVPPKMSKI